MEKKKTKPTAPTVDQHDDDTQEKKEEEEEDAIVDITSMPWEPTLPSSCSRSMFVSQCVVGYAVALLIAFVLVLFVIITTPSTESSASYSSDQHIVSTLTRVGQSIVSHPIASLNVALLYVVFPFVVSVGMTKGGIALLREIIRRTASSSSPKEE